MLDNVKLILRWDIKFKKKIVNIYLNLNVVFVIIEYKKRHV